ncbi:MAG: hypothetical protein PHN64_08980 [Desulfovibrionaceae bacterium]|nr:hypothetical protein [Desulfovibrionaceae bacterium]
MLKKWYYFDPQDYELMNLVQGYVAARAEQRNAPQLDSFLHPHGIIEMGSSHSLRIAHALITLLDSLSDGGKEHRLQALQRLHDEVVNAAQSSFRYNTGRVLIQLMKDLVRSHSEEQSLMLAHDFHKAAQGSPRVIRHLLARYRLLEMPEAWNQQAFDHHVHDGNTKGRKNPTHLVMDAWVKGLRFLTVIYYNRVDADGMEELLRAAAIMDIRVRVGIEFRAAYRNRFVDIIWSPLDCYEPERFYSLMEQPKFCDLMADYAPVSQWMREHTMHLLEQWNTKQAAAFARATGMPCPAPIDKEKFLAFVGHRLPMSLHLAEYIYLSLAKARARALREVQQALESPECTPQAKERLQARQRLISELLPDTIADTWLSPAANPNVVFPYAPHDSMPAIMLRQPDALVQRLAELPPAQIILNLASLTAADVLELVWLGKGEITHLELFNLREWTSGRLQHSKEINELQRALNEGSAPELKHLVQNIMAADKLLDPAAAAVRRPLFETILRNLGQLQHMYDKEPLGSRLGTDSTSRSHTHGMGLAFVETLPRRAQAIVRSASQERHLALPVTTDIYRFVHIHDAECARSTWGKIVRSLPFADWFAGRKVRGWGLEKRTTSVGGTGNLVTLGGVTERGIKAPHLELDSVQAVPPWQRLCYLNSHVINILKVLAGFLPAQWSFWYTDGWWFLVLYGALLWFFITGFRNIIQFIVSGGGFHKDLLLPWKRFISWNRIADSLMYTGISVLLLEVGVRMLLLEQWLGLSVRHDAVLVYSVISLINGFYISLHNIFRGFPRQAVIGNLFRSVFAIPVTVVFGEGLFQVFALAGVADPAALTQTCAAITSKCASDTVAAVIEGIADRNQYLRLRRWDYSTKLQQIFSNFSRQEMLFAHKNIEDYFDKPAELWHMLQARDPLVAREAVVNVLDMLYFWYYLPRAKQVFRQQLARLSPTEIRVVLGIQNMLMLEREVSEMLLDGLVGKNFSRALAFYLVQHESYLAALQKQQKKQQKKPLLSAA